MRKTLAFLGTMLGVFVICLTFAWKAEAAIEVAKFIVGEKSYYVKGEQHDMDVAPFIDENGRVQVPVRFLAYSIGIPENGVGFEVPPGYSNDRGIVALTKSNITMRLEIGSKDFGLTGDEAYGWGGEAYGWGKGPKHDMDTAPVLYNDRVFLPARYVANVFGYEVKWDPLTNAVKILDFSNDPPLYETAVTTPTRIEKVGYNYLEKRLTPSQLKGSQSVDGIVTELNSNTNEITIEVKRASDSSLLDKKITLKVDSDSVLIARNYDITGLITNVADLFEKGQQIDNILFKENRVLAITKYFFEPTVIYGKVLQVKPNELVVKIIRNRISPDDKAIQKIEEKHYGVYYNIGRRIILRPFRWTTISKFPKHGNMSQFIYPPNWSPDSSPPPNFSFDLTTAIKPGMNVSITTAFGYLESLCFDER